MTEAGAAAGEPFRIPFAVERERIAGPLLSFRPIEERDLPDIVSWLADPEVRQFYGDPPGSVEETRQQYLEPDVEPCWRFIIEHEGCGIGEIQYSHQYTGEEWAWSAGMDIFIGEPDARDRGLGTEACARCCATSSR